MEENANRITLPDANDLAIAAYQAYGETTDFKNYQGLPMPTWEELPETIKRAWINASSKVVGIIANIAVEELLR